MSWGPLLPMSAPYYRNRRNISNRSIPISESSYSNIPIITRISDLSMVEPQETDNDSIGNGQVELPSHIKPTSTSSIPVHLVSDENIIDHGFDNYNGLSQEIDTDMKVHKCIKIWLAVFGFATNKYWMMFMGSLFTISFGIQWYYIDYSSWYVCI